MGRSSLLKHTSITIQACKKTKLVSIYLVSMHFLASSLDTPCMQEEVGLDIKLETNVASEFHFKSCKSKHIGITKVHNSSVLPFTDGSLEQKDNIQHYVLRRRQRSAGCIDENPTLFFPHTWMA